MVQSTRECLYGTELLHWLFLDQASQSVRMKHETLLRPKAKTARIYRLLRRFWLAIVALAGRIKRAR